MLKTNFLLLKPSLTLWPSPVFAEEPQPPPSPAHKSEGTLSPSQSWGFQAQDSTLLSRKAGEFSAFGTSHGSLACFSGNQVLTVFRHKQSSLQRLHWSSPSVHVLMMCKKLGQGEVSHSCCSVSIIGAPKRHLHYSCDLKFGEHTLSEFTHSLFLSKIWTCTREALQVILNKVNMLYPIHPLRLGLWFS